MNNTSITFFLPSEFKSTWENLLRDKLIDGFENVYNDSYWLAHIMQDTMKLVYDESRIVINNKIKDMLTFFNIKDDNLGKYLERFRNFFQEHFFAIFDFTDEILNTIREKLLKITDDYRNFGLRDDLETDIQGKSFKIMIHTIFKITMYMLLHDPVLTMNIDPYESREIKYCFYEKGEFINIDGFEKNQTPCIMILSPPLLRSKYPYQGIKPAVYIIPEPSEGIKELCKKNEPSTPKKVKSLNSTKLNFTIENPDFSANKTENNINISLESPKKLKLLEATVKSTDQNFLPTEVVNYNTFPDEALPQDKNKVVKEGKMSVTLEEDEENDKIYINDNLNREFNSKTSSKEDIAYKRCLDQPRSLEKKLISEYSSILLQNLKNNIKSMRDGSSKSNRYYENNKSKSKEHANTENITNVNLSTNNNILDSISQSRPQTKIQSSILRLCEANKINLPLKITKVSSSSSQGNNIFTMKDYKNNLNMFNTHKDKKSGIDIVKAESEFENFKFNTENSASHNYYKTKQIGSADILKSNLKKNVKDAFDYVTNNNHINPLKFEFNNSGKKSTLNDMKYNAPKKDIYVKLNSKEVAENNFKIKVERLYSNMTPENNKILSELNFTAKRDLTSVLEKKKNFMNIKSLYNSSFSHQLSFKK